MLAGGSDNVAISQEKRDPWLTAGGMFLLLGPERALLNSPLSALRAHWEGE